MRHASFTLAISASLILASTSSRAQTPVTGAYGPELAGLDNIVTSWLSSNGLPGITVAVARNGQLLYEKGFGYADPATQLSQMIPSARMQLDSNSVPVTQGALRQMVNSGLLSGSDLVYRSEER